MVEPETCKKTNSIDISKLTNYSEKIKNCLKMNNNITEIPKFTSHSETLKGLKMNDIIADIKKIDGDIRLM